MQRRLHRWRLARLHGLRRARLDNEGERMNIGDMVAWTHITQRGNSITLSDWEGKITEINGDRAKVKRKGVVYNILMKRLRPVDSRHELTEFLLGKEPEP
jgi:hypothetical protein